MIGRRRSANNRLLRRLSRHSNMAILFRKIEPDSPDYQSFATATPYTFHNDMQSVKTSTVISPVPSNYETSSMPAIQAKQNIASPATTIPGKSPQTLPHFVDTGPDQTESPTTPTSDSDPIWRRLQTIFRKHEEKRDSEESEKISPAQEMLEKENNNEPSKSSQYAKDHISPSKKYSKPIQLKRIDATTDRSIETSLTTPPVDQVSAKKLTLTKKDETTPEQSVQDSVSPPKSEVISTQHLLHDKTSSQDSLPKIHPSEDFDQTSLPGLPTQISKKSIEARPASTNTGEAHTIASETQPVIPIPPEDISMNDEEHAPEAQQSANFPNKTQQNTGYAHFSDRFSSSQPDVPIPTVPTSPTQTKQTPPPVHPLEETTTEKNVAHPQSLPLEKAWPVKTAIRHAPVQPSIMQSTAETPVEDIHEIELPPVEKPDQNQEIIVNQILQEVSPAQSTESSIEIIHPRQPRPCASIQKSTMCETETKKHSTFLPNEQAPDLPAPAVTPADSDDSEKRDIPTDIGPLPADLWQLIGEKPPQYEIPQSSKSAPPKTQTQIEHEPLSTIYSANQPLPSSAPEFFASTSPPAISTPPVMTSPVQRQAESTPTPNTAPEPTSPIEEGEDKEKEDKEIKELAHKVYSEIRKRLFLENERFHMH